MESSKTTTSSTPSIPQGSSKVKKFIIIFIIIIVIAGAVIAGLYAGGIIFQPTPTTPPPTTTPTTPSAPDLFTGKLIKNNNFNVCLDSSNNGLYQNKDCTKNVAKTWKLTGDNKLMSSNKCLDADLGLKTTCTGRWKQEGSLLKLTAGGTGCLDSNSGTSQYINPTCDPNNGHLQWTTISGFKSNPTEVKDLFLASPSR